MENKVMNLSTFGEIIQPDKNSEMSFADVLSQISGSRLGEDPEIIEIPSPESEEEQEVVHQIEEVNSNWAHFIKCSFEYILCIKMLHWQTHSLGEHKAMDKLFNGMLPIMDLIAETAMGKYGRPIADGWTIPVCNYESPKHLSAYLEEMAHCYNTKCRSLFNPENDSEILNTLDTLIELINKTRYLVTLK